MLRRICALPGTADPPRPIVGAPPTILTIDPGDLWVDETYQRELSGKRSIALIRRIVHEWDWLKFKPPIVVRAADGRMNVVDGQHTSTAAHMHPGITTIPVVYHDDVQGERAAQAFIGHNRDNLRVTPVQIFFAALAAGDESAEQMARVCQTAGVRILRYPVPHAKCRPGDCFVFGGIQVLLRRYKEEEVVEILSTAVRGYAAPISALLLRALELLRFDENLRGLWNPDIYAVLIKNAGPRLEIEGRAMQVSNNLTNISEGVAVWLAERRENWRT